MAIFIRLAKKRYRRFKNHYGHMFSYTKLLAKKWPFLTEVVIFYPSSEIGFPFSPNRIEGIPCFDVDFLSV